MSIETLALKTPQSFVAALSRIRLRSVFNPYADRCPEYDRHDAARIRRRNLVRYLEGALETNVDTMWIARDLGYRSGRRTGIPITDELHLARAAAIGGVQLNRATLGPPVAERTSTVVWGMLARIGDPSCCGTRSLCTRTNRRTRSPTAVTRVPSGRQRGHSPWR